MEYICRVSVGKEFALLFAVLFLPGMLAQPAGVDAGAFEDLTYHLQILVVSVPQILLVVALAGLRRPGSPHRFGWRRPVAADGLAGAFALVSAWLAVGLISLVTGLSGSGDLLDPVVAWSFSRRELIPVAFLSTMAIGYREEIFFRAYLTDRAEELGVDARLALGGGAVLFALGHLYQGVMGFVVSLAIGLVFAGVYLRSRSLHGIAVAHGLYNFVVLLAAGSA